MRRARDTVVDRVAQERRLDLRHLHLFYPPLTPLEQAPLSSVPNRRSSPVVGSFPLSYLITLPARLERVTNTN